MKRKGRDIMYTDMFGKKRVKVGLHHHTTLSDGHKTPNETAALYRDAGYDAIAITDHWKYGNSQELEGLSILPGAEYNVGANDTLNGVYHILCLFADGEPQVEKEMPAQQIIDAIHAVNGLAVLAHPAWSLNTPEMIRNLSGIDATEIFNTVSDKGHSRRADSSLIVDMLAVHGTVFPLLASDDSHYYGEGNLADATTAFIMAESDSVDDAALKKAIIEKRFYASTGPEIHLTRDGDTFTVHCSPAQEIVFMTSAAWAPRVTTGENLTTATYTIRPFDTFVRAYVTDKNGKRAWTNIVEI